MLLKWTQSRKGFSMALLMGFRFGLTYWLNRSIAVCARISQTNKRERVPLGVLERCAAVRLGARGRCARDKHFLRPIIAASHDMVIHFVLRALSDDHTLVTVYYREKHNARVSRVLCVQLARVVCSLRTAREAHTNVLDFQPLLLLLLQPVRSLAWCVRRNYSAAAAVVRGFFSALCGVRQKPVRQRWTNARVRRRGSTRKRVRGRACSPLNGAQRRA